MNHIHLLSKKKISSLALTCLNLLDQVAIKTDKHISAAPASPMAGTGWLATILMYQREEPADQSAGSGGLRESVGELLSPRRGCPRSLLSSGGSERPMKPQWGSTSPTRYFRSVSQAVTQLRLKTTAVDFFLRLAGRLGSAGQFC